MFTIDPPAYTVSRRPSSWRPFHSADSERTRRFPSCCCCNLEINSTRCLCYCDCDVKCILCSMRAGQACRPSLRQESTAFLRHFFLSSSASSSSYADPERGSLTRLLDCEFSRSKFTHPFTFCAASLCAFVPLLRRALDCRDSPLAVLCEVQNSFRVPLPLTLCPPACLPACLCSASPKTRQSVLASSPRSPETAICAMVSLSLCAAAVDFSRSLSITHTHAHILSHTHRHSHTAFLKFPLAPTTDCPLSLA